VSDSTAPGRIELRGLRLTGYCGVLPEEQQREQPLEFDIDLDVDLSAAAESDDLSDTVDYGAVCAGIETLLATTRFALLERLATEAARACLEHPGVLSADVAVRKLRPPVSQQLATSGVRCRITRP